MINLTLKMALFHLFELCSFVSIAASIKFRRNVDQAFAYIYYKLGRSKQNILCANGDY